MSNALALSELPQQSENLWADRALLGTLAQDYLSSQWGTKDEVNFRRTQLPEEEHERRRSFVDQFGEQLRLKIQKVFRLSPVNADYEYKDSMSTGDHLLYDFTVAHINDALIFWILKSPDAHAQPLGNVVSRIRAIQCHNSLTQHPGDKPLNTLSQDDLLREEGDEVWSSGRAMVLPYLQGKFAQPAFDNLLVKLEQEFQRLPPEEAIRKAKIYFNLAMIIHPQKDFNKRTFRHFFRHLASRSTDKEVTINDEEFVPSFEEIREALFVHYFPELADDRCLRWSFIKTFHRDLFDHSVNPAEEFEALMASSNLGHGASRFFSKPKDEWEFRYAKGVTKGAVEYFILLHDHSHIFQVDNLFERLQRIQSLNMLAEYHQTLFTVCEKL